MSGATLKGWSVCAKRRSRNIDFFDDNGLALVWLSPWDGATSLRPEELDPYYVEICRRVRLGGGGWAHSRARRRQQGGAHRLRQGGQWAHRRSLDAYRDQRWRSQGSDHRRARLFLSTHVGHHDSATASSPRACKRRRPQRKRQTRCCLSRARWSAGRAKRKGCTSEESWRPAKIVALMADAKIDENEVPAKKRIEQAGLVGKALRFGLMMLFQNGPPEFRPRDPNSAKRGDPFLDRFENRSGPRFFRRSLRRGRSRKRCRENRRSQGMAPSICGSAPSPCLRPPKLARPSPSIRRHRAMVRAESALHNSFYKSFRDPYFPKDEHHDAA